MSVLGGTLAVIRRHVAPEGGCVTVRGRSQLGNSQHPASVIAGGSWVWVPRALTQGVDMGNGGLWEYNGGCGGAVKSRIYDSTRAARHRYCTVV